MAIMKTAELIGVALDWAVVVANRVPKSDIKLPRKSDLRAYKRIYRLSRDSETGKLKGSYETGPEFLPSARWESGGPIIQRECISIYFHVINDLWWSTHKNGNKLTHSGATPLIAAMRCFVASKLGEEVEIPEELL